MLRSHVVLLTLILVYLTYRTFHVARYANLVSVVPNEEDLVVASLTKGSQTSKKRCVMVRTSFPFTKYALDTIGRLADELEDSEYDFVVRVDETQQTGAEQFLDRYMVGRRNQTPPFVVSSITLPTLFNAYPIFRQYLYDPSINTHGKIGDCCGRPPMWQAAVVNDVHFVMNHTMYEHVWMVEDDIRIAGNVSSLSKQLMLKDVDVGNVPFVAVQSYPSMKYWMKRRHTLEFDKVVQAMGEVKWLALSDGLRRMSRSAANSFHLALQQGLFAHVESFGHPILWAKGIETHWWNLTGLWHLVDKLTEGEAVVALQKLNRYRRRNRQKEIPWALYQLSHDPTPRHIIVTFSSFKNERQTFLFLESYQVLKKELDADLFILTNVARDDPNRARWATKLMQCNATVVDAQDLFQSIRAELPGIAAFNPLKVFVLSRWLQNTKPFKPEDIVLVTDEDVVFTRGDLFSAFGAFQKRSLLIFPEKEGVMANFNRWTQECWDHTTDNATIHDMVGSQWQMYCSGVILSRGDQLYKLYTRWSEAMKMHGSPKCDQTYLNYLIHTNNLNNLGLERVSWTDPYWVSHLTTEKDRYNVFLNTNVSIVHQYKWCKQCVEDLEQQFGFSGAENSTSSNESSHETGHSPIRSGDSTWAVVLIALGKTIPHNQLVERCVQSIRRRGMHDGRVIVITDAPQERFINLTHADGMVTTINVSYEKVGFRNRRMEAWRYKTFILDIMDKDSTLSKYEHILYIDVDIIVGDRLQTFFHYLDGMERKLSFKQESYMLMFEDGGKGKEVLQQWQKEDNSSHGSTTYFHAGAIVLHRQRSRQCLALRRDLFTSFKDDQHAILHMTQNHELQKNCSVVQMDSEPFLHFPTKESMQNGTTSVLVHVTISRRAVIIPDDIQRDYFRQTMQLDESLALPLCGKWGTCA